MIGDHCVYADIAERNEILLRVNRPDVDQNTQRRCLADYSCADPIGK